MWPPVLEGLQGQSLLNRDILQEYFFQEVRIIYHLTLSSTENTKKKKKHEVFGNLATISSPSPKGVPVPQPHQRVPVTHGVCVHTILPQGETHGKTHENPILVSPIIWGFPKIPNNSWFSYLVTKDDHFGGVLGYHHSRKPPYNNNDFLKIQSMRRMRRSKCVTSKDLVLVLLAVWQTRCFAHSLFHSVSMGSKRAPANQRPSLGLPVFDVRKSRVL